VTSLIKKSDKKIKELGQISNSDLEHTDFQICKNMQMVYADRLKTLTFEMRRMEKAHYAKVQELHGVEDNGDLESGEQKITDDMMVIQETD